MGVATCHEITYTHTYVYVLLCRILQCQYSTVRRGIHGHCVTPPRCFSQRQAPLTLMIRRWSYYWYIVDAQDGQPGRGELLANLTIAFFTP